MNQPNILFLLIDSLRADKCSGQNRKCKTPNLDNLIESGTYFSQAISPSDATLISLRSIKQLMVKNILLIIYILNQVQISFMYPIMLMEQEF